jgi:hypothetical protein
MTTYLYDRQRTFSVWRRNRRLPVIYRADGLELNFNPTMTRKWPLHVRAGRVA